MRSIVSKLLSNEHLVLSQDHSQSGSYLTTPQISLIDGTGLL